MNKNRKINKSDGTEMPTKIPENINVVNSFNMEFKTDILRPITYDFTEDVTIWHNVNF